MNLQGKKVLVIGCGKSGVGAAELLYQAGAMPVLYDGNEKLDKASVYEQLPEGAKAQIYLGSIPDDLAGGLSLVLVSPGVPVDTPFIRRFSDAGIPVWGEVELAWQFERGKVIAITGTNGKTTTTALTGEIMRHNYPSVFVVGNIGTPYTQEAANTGDSVTVAEISSYQLETTVSFHPTVSAILNITPDHLNRHHTMENYVAIKESITKNQTKDDYCILNYEDGYTREFGSRCPADVIYFSSKRRLEQGYYLDGDMICRNMGSGQEILMNVHDMKLVGVHNYENVMAAIAICSAFGAPMDHIISVVKNFRAVEHRIEYVATKKGVVYYNDSKGTNPDAAIQGIRAMSRPTILIGGGYDKQGDYDEWIEAFEGKVKLLVLIGQTREKIAECARAHGFCDIVLADSFEDAMEICVKNAADGDAVLLSPACASWGMFPNYEVRGNIFKDFVRQIEE